MLTKAPIEGAVKTRLAKDIGNTNACDIHKQLVTKTLGTVQIFSCLRKQLYCAPTIDDPYLMDLAEQFNLSLHQQCAGDIGVRMHHALDQALANDECDWAMLVGTDCPDLSVIDLTSAQEKLESDNDVVIGPAMDGGYYLIGFSKKAYQVFDGITWSTSLVLDQTKRILEKKALKWAEIALHRDIDNLQDILEYDDLFTLKLEK